MAIVAIGQICSTSSMAHNLEQCVRLMRTAAAASAKVLFLPEASDYMPESAKQSFALAQPMSQSPFVKGLQLAAKECQLAVNVGIHVPCEPDLAGSSTTTATTAAAATPTPTPTPTPTKLLNRTIHIDATGRLLAHASYDKLHLFDYGSLRESASVRAGAAVVPPFHVDGVGRVGSQICFDLRFPEPAVRLAHPGRAAESSSSSPSSSTAPSGSESGSEPSPPESTSHHHQPCHQPAHIITYPSAFTVRTGRAHWEVLLRARAIESQCYVVAAAQVGVHHDDGGGGGGSGGPGGRLSYGHSMAVDPWGTVVCRLGGVGEDGAVEEGAVGAMGLVDIDLDLWERVRREMPLVRRTDVYPQI